MADVPTIRLNNGVEMPQLGFGVFQVPPDEVVDPVRTAIESGYRLIDTAAAYQNEEGVGKAIADGGVPRDQLFVTTKLWNADQGYDNALRAFDVSLGKLGLDYVDLYLIHWPLPKRDRYVDTWKAFEKIYADGRARAIGVSNFTQRHLNRLFDETEIVPMLKAAPELRAVAIFEKMQRRHPALSAGVRRTLERRIRSWRALHGADQEVIFRQVLRTTRAPAVARAADLRS